MNSQTNAVFGDAFAHRRARRPSVRGHRRRRSRFNAHSNSQGQFNSHSSDRDVTTGGDERELGWSTHARTNRRVIVRLRQTLREAIEREDFEACARARDALRVADPREGLRKALTNAIADERYDIAGKLRDEIKALDAEEDALDRAPSVSRAVTRGIVVEVRAEYQPARSSPATGAYFHAYTVTITNASNEASKVKLLSRSWLITDGQGRCESVKGAGVIGQQPTLAVGESFTYASACPLRTPRGTMEGFYRFVELDAKVDGDEIELVPRGEFDAEVAVFGLDAT